MRKNQKLNSQIELLVHYLKLTKNLKKKLSKQIKQI